MEPLCFQIFFPALSSHNSRCSLSVRYKVLHNRKQTGKQHFLNCILHIQSILSLYVSVVFISYSHFKIFGFNDNVDVITGSSQQLHADCLNTSFTLSIIWMRWSQWPRGLRRRSAAARLLRLWVWIPPEAWMSPCCECCVLSGRGLCDELITCPEESYRL
jgi:hypothetical protein